MGFDPAHHALTPPVVPYALRNGGSWPVVAVERKRDVLVELGSILCCALANLIENFDRRSARVLVGFDHDWWNSADQHCLPRPLPYFATYRATSPPPVEWPM